MTQPAPPEDTLRRAAFRTLLASFRELEAADQAEDTTPEDSKAIVLGFCDSLDAMRQVMLTRQNLTDREIQLFHQSIGAYAGLLMGQLLGDIGDDLGPAPFRTLFEDLIFDEDDEELAVPTPTPTPVPPS